ncbi:MAG TPA: alpha/beta hydrolase [Anaerolineaceae bacterium]
MESKRSDRQSVSIAYHAYRERQPAPLVVAHGLSDNRLCWHDTALDLETRTDVIMPDSRGHGLSARLARDEAIDLAGEMAGIISALGLRRPIVSDHSMGGTAVTRLGAHYPDRPGLMSLEGVIDEPGQPADHLDF